MTDTAVPTLAPAEDDSKTQTAETAAPSYVSTNADRENLFKSIAAENLEEGSERSPLKMFFTGLLWFGYSVAIAVALVLVWSAASGLMKSLPR